MEQGIGYEYSFLLHRSINKYLRQNLFITADGSKGAVLERLIKNTVPIDLRICAFESRERNLKNERAITF
jgi:hypothetical protein